MIKALVFDCFGVLTGDAWKEFVGQFPIETQDKLRSLNLLLDTGELSADKFCDSVAKLTNITKEEVLTIINTFNGKNVRLLGYIAELKRHYKIAMLSNISNDRIRHEFFTADELALFDVLVLSSEIKTVKPDPKAFKITAERLAVLPSECLMVDDSATNCHAAQAVGMKAIVYQNFVSFKNDFMSILN